MATTNPNTPKCHFNTLSGELRNRIYSYFFSTLLTPIHPTTLDIRYYPSLARLTRNAPKSRSALALTATSRQLRQETLALFWSHISLRIVSGTLTAYSQPQADDSVPGVHPMNRAHHINQDRAECLREWLTSSGIAKFARLSKPVELDLGMWDPRAHEDAHQFIVLRLLGGDTLELTRLLKGALGGGRTSFADDDDDNNNNNNKNDYNNLNGTNTGKKPSAGCTLRFKVQVEPATALGSICVANERTHALASIAALCEGRSARVQAQFQKGLLTTNGHQVLLQDVAMCRSLAEVLVAYIVEEEQQQEEEEEGPVDGDASKGGQSRRRKLAGKKGQQGGT